jgi:hypothetical protein
VKAKLENFERAFDAHVGTCRAHCHCGKEYWDGHNDGYSWDDGEVEALEADPEATKLDYSVGFVEFEGKQYVNACDCWHKRAEQIIAFIDGHGREIADYLTREKRRLQAIADTAPVVEGDPHI